MNNFMLEHPLEEGKSASEMSQYDLFYLLQSMMLVFNAEMPNLFSSIIITFSFQNLNENDQWPPEIREKINSVVNLLAPKYRDFYTKCGGVIK